MVVRLGQSRHKSFTMVPRVLTVPRSDHMTNLGVFESIYANAGSVTVFEKASSIYYTTKRRSERFKSNSCRHLISTVMYAGPAVNPTRLTFTSAGHVNHYCDYYDGHRHGRIAHDLAVNTAYGPTQLNVAATPTYYGSALTDINNEYANLRPDLTTMSLPNFLVELDDVGKLFQIWKKNVGIAKNAAGAHLNYSFGWKPLMSDIRNMVATLEGLMDRISEFEKAANMTLKSHRKFFNEVTAKSGTFTYSVQSPVKWSGFIERSKSAGLTYRPQPFQVTRGYKMMLRAYLDALGFELNPSIIWDALPFTFVLDWFFGIGSWLERHKYDTLELPFLHLDSYVQYKEDVKVTSDLTINPDSFTLPDQFTMPYWVTTRKFFERVPINPAEQSFIDAGWKLPTANQAILGISLATVLKR